MRGGTLLLSSLGTKRGHLDLQLYHRGPVRVTDERPSTQAYRVSLSWHQMRMAAPKHSHHPQEKMKVSHNFLSSGLLSQVSFVGYLKFREKRGWSRVFLKSCEVWILTRPCHGMLDEQQYRDLWNVLTPVLRLPLVMQPARQGLKYVIPSDPQTGSYSCILQPQLTLQLPVRFLWGMVREGLREKRGRSQATFTKIKLRGKFLISHDLLLLEEISPLNQTYGAAEQLSWILICMTSKQNIKKSVTVFWHHRCNAFVPKYLSCLDPTLHLGAVELVSISGLSRSNPCVTTNCSRSVLFLSKSGPRRLYL